MSPDRAIDPSRVQSAFAEAAGLSTLDRDAFLAALRDESDALATEVASLLSYHSRVVVEPFDTSSSLPASLIGQSIAGCVIGGLVGYGGMSVVYAATQAFPRRQVAVKLVRRERLSASARRRLRVEAEALARLDHPNIARVYAAGVQRIGDREDDSETPYIVMELIEGAEVLPKWANERSLDAKTRIQLVATIADAIEHAHRAGVIHRDVKPGNVIVGRDGVPKVIDFGIASVLDSSVTAPTEGPMGTLAYMSPEQARGAAVDTRSDVWGLGALLYDLLAGSPPFDPRGTSVAAHVNRLLHDTAPAVRESAREFRGVEFAEKIPTPIDAVLRKALANDPDRRYRSAAEFADELRRLIAGEALLARPDSEWDTMWRLMRRHRASLFAVSGIFVAVSTGLILALTLLQRESAANERATWSAYVASMSAANAMVERGDASAAHAMLANAPEVHRGWEWRALARQASQSKWALALSGGAQVYGVDWTTDGKFIVAAASDAVVKIDRATEKVAWSCAMPTSEAAWRVRVMADGAIIALQLDGALVRISRDGEIEARSSRANKPELAPDLATDAARTRLFSNTLGGAIEIDPVTLAEARRIEATPSIPEPARAIAVAPDGSVLATGDRNGLIVCFDALTGALRWERRTATSALFREVRAVSFSPDGCTLAAVSPEGVALLDARSGAVIWTHDDTTRDYRGCVFTPNGTEIIASSWAETIERLDARDGRVKATITGAFSQVWASAVSPDGRDIAAGTLAARVEVFDAIDSAAHDVYQLDGSAVRCVSGGERVFAATTDGTLWEVRGRRAQRIEVPTASSVKHANWVCELRSGELAIAHDGGVAIASVTDARLEIIREIATPAAATRIGATRDGQTLLVHGADSSMRAIDVLTLNERWTVSMFNRDSHLPVETAAAGVFLLPRGWGGKAAYFDARTARESPITNGLEYPSMGESSPDMKRIAVASVMNSGEVSILDARAETVLALLPNHRAPARVVRWNADGSRLASASVDGTVRIWHVQRAAEILVAWRGQAHDLAWSEDGTLWIACEDGAVRAIRVTAPK